MLPPDPEPEVGVGEEPCWTPPDEKPTLGLELAEPTGTAAPEAVVAAAPDVGVALKVIDKELMVNPSAAHC